MTTDSSAVAALTEAELAAVADRLTEAGETLAGPLTSRLIAGGRSNLTFRLDDEAAATASDGGTAAWVLRMPPRAGRTPSAHDVAREFRVTRALHGTDVPVARAVALCEDEDVLGGPFAVTEFVRGSTVQSAEDLAALDDAAVAASVDRLVEALAALHAVDHVAAGLERFGRPDAYAARQLRRWSGQWELVGDESLRPLAADLSGRLVSSVPDQRAVGIVHGDFRIDNTLLRLDDTRPERVAVAAVVDWELSTIGDPVADVAMMCVYRDPVFDLVLGSPCAWTSDRLPDVTALAAAYESAGGVTLDHWDFHLALGYFKLAVISAGIDHRFRAGAAHGDGFDTAGDAVAPLLEAGLDVLGR